MSEHRLTLPWPPSVNHYWRRVGSRTLISKQGRKYRENVQALIAATNAFRQAVSERLAVEIIAYQPDRRRRDLDNVLKAPLDAMQHSGVYEDDSNIDYLWISRAYDKGDPRLEVTIRTMEESP